MSWQRIFSRPGLICLAIAALAALSMGRQWGGPIMWDLDSLYYQAQTMEIRGDPAQTARHEAFTGPLSARPRSLDADEKGEPVRIGRPAWIDFTSDYYRRRWVVPLMAAAVYPVLSVHSLETLSLLGYVALGPLLFLLLRLRFGSAASIAATLCCLALPPLRDWSIFPLTDSWGLALEVAALLAAVAVLTRGPRWLAPWALAVCALAFTRDTAFIPVIAVGLLALGLRTRRSLALLGTGVLAALPAPLIFGGGAREQLAYVLTQRDIPPETGWGYIAREYWPNLRDMLGDYAAYVADNPVVIAAFVIGLALLYAAPVGRGDSLLMLLRAVPAGYLALLAVGPTFSAFRYELVLVPSVAAGLAIGLERVAVWLPGALRKRGEPQTVTWP